MPIKLSKQACSTPLVAAHVERSMEGDVQLLQQNSQVDGSAGRTTAAVLQAVRCSHVGKRNHAATSRCTVFKTSCCAHLLLGSLDQFGC